MVRLLDRPSANTVRSGMFVPGVEPPRASPDIGSCSLASLSRVGLANKEDEPHL